MKTRGFFITGTDTGVGKTGVTVNLMHWLRSRGLTVIAMKPVATGCVLTAGCLVNEDAERLREAASVNIAYEKVNPYAFEPAASPHIAARLSGQTIDLDGIVRQCRELQQMADCMLVEGVGGWQVPSTGQHKVSDLADALGFPVILVVGMRLGCLNHALLTYAALSGSGIECAGWIANQPGAQFAFLAENIETLVAELPCPYLGLLPHHPAAGIGSGKSLLAGDFVMEGGDQILRRLRV